MNLLYGLYECGLSDTHFTETTTTGAYGAPHFLIPECGLEVDRKGGTDEVPFPAMGESRYHQTTSFDVANIRLAESQFEFPMSELRTAIVYGTEMPETKAHESSTRFDFDYYFGTMVNRFCAQAVAGYPTTVHGRGKQRKPMVGLKDTVENLVRLAEDGHSGDGIDIYNQMTRLVVIVEVAKTIAEVDEEFDLNSEVKHYENPRNKDKEHKMEMKMNSSSNSSISSARSLRPGFATSSGRSSKNKTGSQF